MKFTVVKTQTGLRPMYDSDFENYAKIKIGEEFQIEYKKIRNLKFHRKYFSLLKLAFENQSDYRNLNDMRYDLTIVAGYYDEHVNKITGEIFKKAKSISFANMENTEFSELYESIKNVISKWLSLSSETIEDEILQYY